MVLNQCLSKWMVSVLAVGKLVFYSILGCGQVYDIALLAIALLIA